MPLGVQLSESAARELDEMHTWWRGQRQGSRRAPKRGYGRVGGVAVEGQSVAIKKGLVASGSGASWDDADLELTESSISALPLLDVTDLPPFDEATSYSAGDKVYLAAAPAFSETATYNQGDRITRDVGGDLNVYAAKADNTGPGAFTGVEWDLYDTVGGYVADASTGPGVFDKSEWDDLDDTVLHLAGDAVSLPYDWTDNAIPGALVKWIEIGDEKEIIWLTCEAIEGYGDG